MLDPKRRWGPWRQSFYHHFSKTILPPTNCFLRYYFFPHSSLEHHLLIWIFWHYFYPYSWLFDHKWKEWEKTLHPDYTGLIWTTIIQFWRFQSCHIEFCGTSLKWRLKFVFLRFHPFKIVFDVPQADFNVLTTFTISRWSCHFNMIAPNILTFSGGKKWKCLKIFLYLNSQALEHVVLPLCWLLVEEGPTTQLSKGGCIRNTESAGIWFLHLNGRALGHGFLPL